MRWCDRSSRKLQSTIGISNRENRYVVIDRPGQLASTGPGTPAIYSDPGSSLFIVGQVVIREIKHPRLPDNCDCASSSGSAAAFDS